MTADEFLEPVVEVGEDWLLFRGPLPDIAPHRHPVGALVTSLANDFRLKPPLHGCESAAAVFIPADSPAPAMDFGGHAQAILFLSPMTGVYRRLARDFAGDPRALPANELRLLFREMDMAGGAPNLEARLEALLPGAPSGWTMDPRVARIAAMIRETPAENIPLAELAAAAELSAPRLLHLFKDNTGVPIRRYRLWERMRQVSRAVVRGANLTDAALGAGFSDSAHLARAARDMFGLSLSEALGRNWPRRSRSAAG